MPRRLGDDPLSRKKPSSAKDPTSAQPAPALQASHNDVFFRRRAENPQPKTERALEEQGLREATDVDEKPEITEVADIVRTARAAMSTQGAGELAAPVSSAGSVSPPVERPVEKTVLAPSMVSAPVPPSEPSPPVAEEPAAPASSQSGAQPQKSEGFFKRLFGRFGK